MSAPSELAHAQSARRAGSRLMRLAATLGSAAVVMGAVLTAGPPARADVPPTMPSTVAADLGASNVPAALVVLVDISLSMSGSRGGLYPQVRTELPQFLSALRKQDPQDRVAVVVFGAQSDTRTIYPMGTPTSNLPLPADATSEATDIGYAFAQALDNLSQAGKNIQVGGVLLLSDGGINAPADPTYDGGAGYNAPGWAALRREVQGLGIPVTGYGLPLTSNPSDIAALDAALAACFGAHRQLLSSSFSNLSSQLELAQQAILDKRVTAAAAPDSGRGVAVSWTAPGGGATALDLGTGHASVSVKLTSTTQHVPLEVSGLSVHSAGYPVAISGKVPSAIVLQPGQSVTVPVPLTWQRVTAGASLTGGGKSWPGRLIVDASVSSPFSDAINNFYQDKSFTVGGLTGNTNAGFPGTAPASASLLYWLLLILLVVVLLALAAAMRARLAGAITLTTTAKDTETKNLPSRPWFSWWIGDQLRKEGKVTIYGSPFSRKMRIRLRHSSLPDSDNTLLPGGRTMIAGIDVKHDEFRYDDLGHEGGRQVTTDREPGELCQYPDGRSWPRRYLC